ncbi:MAG: hypothetical protein M1840_000946 [Geoglossum simile]|nr:MAG: hypothetical protein M1840_000946 [Geoglossum simile]
MALVALVAIAVVASLAPVAAQSSTSTCSVPKPSYSAPSIASGYTAAPIATGLFQPRGILLDTSGRILVVERNRGIVALTLNDGGGICLSVKENKTVVANKNLNHGIALSNDGKTLYASTMEAVFSWAYDPESGSTGANKTLIVGMANGDHITRTLLLSQKVPGILVVSRGSGDNIDKEVVDIKVTRSQLKAFDLNTIGNKTYDFTKDGTLIGWGLRNAVGVAEDPSTGAIYTVENSVDDLRRLGKDIHTNNPGEELNFHGYLNGTKTAEQGGNYGYPQCLAAWDVNDIPENRNLTVGKQFAVDITDKINDDFCQKERIPPRLTFQAHQAPLDIKFSADGKEAYVTFHGSWNRDIPVGYKLSVISFSGGFPTAPSDSNNSTTDVLSIANSITCPHGSLAGIPDSYPCFRPVGLAWDKNERLFMSSDATGEIWVISKRNEVAPAPTTSEGSADTGKPAATTTGGVKMWGVGSLEVVMLLAGLLAHAEDAN